MGPLAVVSSTQGRVEQGWRSVLVAANSLLAVGRSSGVRLSVSRLASLDLIEGIDNLGTQLTVGLYEIDRGFGVVLCQLPLRTGGCNLFITLNFCVSDPHVGVGNYLVRPCPLLHDTVVMDVPNEENDVRPLREQKALADAEEEERHLLRISQESLEYTYQSGNLGPCARQEPRDPRERCQRRKPIPQGSEL